MNSSASPYLDLSTVIRCLRGAVGGWGGRGLLSTALVLLLYRRLGGICGQMERLVARFQAGRIWRRGPRAAVAGKLVSNGRVRAVPAVQLSGRFGWLVWAASYQAAGYGCQLRAILGQPEMVALLMAAPQAARILRPVCRMLAVETSLLRPRLEGAAVGAAVEPEPETQASGAVVKVRVRKPRVAVDWGRIPLPRGVLAAARRQGFGKCR